MGTVSRSLGHYAHAFPSRRVALRRSHLFYASRVAGRVGADRLNDGQATARARARLLAQTTNRKDDRGLRTRDAGASSPSQRQCSTHWVGPVPNLRDMALKTGRRAPLNHLLPHCAFAYRAHGTHCTHYTLLH